MVLLTMKLSRIMVALTKFLSNTLSSIDRLRMIKSIIY